MHTDITKNMYYDQFVCTLSVRTFRKCHLCNELTLMLLVSNFTKIIFKKMTETLTHGFSSRSTQQELSNEYQHDRVKMVFKHLCVRATVLWMKVASALEG